MSILKTFEHAKWNPMMDVLDGALAASLAGTAASLHYSNPSGLPANPIASRCSALPAWMRLATLKLGLPFSHAGSIAECQRGVKISGRPSHALPAPVAKPRDAVRPPRIWPSPFGLLCAYKGAIFLSILGAGLATDAARWLRLRFAPSVFQVARSRAESAIGTAIQRMVLRAASLARLHGIWIYHTVIIPHSEIEERYCEIAVKRLAQSVLQFTDPIEQPLQQSLL